MKKDNTNIKKATLLQTKRWLTMTIMILISGLMTACQLTEPTNDKNSNNNIAYNQYYLWLKSLNAKQILTEEEKQIALIKNQLHDKTNTQGKLILIYSLPNTTLHNPYKAKRLLNEHLLASNTLTKDNVAFTMLLRDQLNTQLHLLKKEKELRQQFNRIKEENNSSIEQLTQQLDHVNHQLMLLKQIDQNINKRG